MVVEQAEAPLLVLWWWRAATCWLLPVTSCPQVTQLMVSSLHSITDGRCHRCYNIKNRSPPRNISNQYNQKISDAEVFPPFTSVFGRSTFGSANSLRGLWACVDTFQTAVHIWTLQCFSTLLCKTAEALSGYSFSFLSLMWPQNLNMWVRSQ